MKMHSFQHYSHAVEMTVHDSWITAKVKSALALADPTLGLHINVKTYAGRVILGGRVNSHKERDHAISLVRAVQGVAEIDASDLLTHVFKPGTFPEAPNAEENPETRPQSSTRLDDK
ncbi:BON domain-containing protein [Pseudomonas sp. NA-150]|uniref:BON domain-containing protein n=1 Tax=Pseudomonas sp. NA-150 TaxID=3367525 RepID=UPI0037C8F231